MSHIHIPDGVLPVWLWAGGWVVTLVLVAVAGKLSERSEVRRKVPLLAVVSALMLVAMSSEIVPIAYHINLTVVGGILLGPVLSVIASFIVEVVLAMLGHGGVTVLGLNTALIATEMVLGWLLFHAFVRALGRPRVRLAAGGSTVLTLATTTTLLVVMVAIAGGGLATQRETGALDLSTLSFENPFGGGVFSVGLFGGGEASHEAEGEASGEHAGDQGGRPVVPEGAEQDTRSVRRFATVVYTLGSIGWLIEALITVAIVGYVARVRPSLIWEGALGELQARLPAHETGIH